MKPVRLAMQAFGPYPGRVTLDFRNAVATGIFGIYGQTGAGKSSIFSAMTFALFGEAANKEQNRESLRSDHAEPHESTEVEFVFDLENKRYAILRRPEQTRPVKRGEGETNVPHAAYLYDATGIALEDIDTANGRAGRIIAEKKVKTVDEAVEETLGYSATQFRQIVLLPQGKFETFLSAKTKDRLEILRDLFDVSLFRQLMETLSSEAEKAEQEVRHGRAFCAQQLSAEGFESSDALAAGIEAAESLHAKCLEDERREKDASDQARKDLEKANSIDEKFEHAEEAEREVADILSRDSEIDEIDDRAKRAERASRLLGFEKHADDAGKDFEEAEDKMQEAIDAAEMARAAAMAANEELDKQNARKGEIDDLTRQIENCERYESILARASESERELEEARENQKNAAAEFDVAKDAFERKRESIDRKGVALGEARATEQMRAAANDRIKELSKSLDDAKAFEKATGEVRQAEIDLEKQVEANVRASSLAKTAKSNLEKAEGELSEVQALHLASKLVDHAPCPVCGSTEHPAPAAGEIEAAGFDLAFRNAKDADEKAAAALLDSEKELARLEASLQERNRIVDRLNCPSDSSNVIAPELEAERLTLAELEPEMDIEAMEKELKELKTELPGLETELEARRVRDSACRQASATVSAQLEEMRSPVPEYLRDPDALDSEKGRIIEEQAKLQEAWDLADKTAKETRDAKTKAVIELQSAEKHLKGRRQAHAKATDRFNAQLTKAGFTTEEFRTSKAGIETMDTDREAVENHRANLQRAQGVLNAANEMIEGLERPDIEDLRTREKSASEALSKATEKCAEAKSTADKLKNLRDNLSEMNRRLQEKEEASASLRELARLAKGENPRRLNLETYAIGAMFSRVLEGANQRLAPMTANRYRFERDDEGSGRGYRGLGLRIFDYHTGKPRPAATLSGGETFIAALALALGLADVVESESGKVRLDTIFIDEGFGSLDTANGSGTLDQVLQVLNSIVSQSRSVGLISHVPMVQEAIPNGFHVIKGLGGSIVNEKGPI